MPFDDVLDIRRATPRPQCDYCPAAGGLVFWYSVNQNKGTAICMRCAPVSTENGGYRPPGPETPPM